MKFYYTLFLLIFFSNLIAAQNNWVILDSTNSPLQNNLLRVVESDSYGNIWLGTNNGLYKFDGVFWINYTTNNSQIPYDQVDNFYLDRNDNIWFMTGSSTSPYFVKYDGENWETVDSNQTCFPDSSYLSRNFVVDSYGTKWINIFSNQIRYDSYGCIYFDYQDVGILTTDCLKIDLDINDNFSFISQTYEIGYLGGIARTTAAGWLYNPLYGQYAHGFTIDNEANLVWVSSSYENTNLNGILVKMTYDSLQILNIYNYFGSNQQEYRWGFLLKTDLNGNIWQILYDLTQGRFDKLGLLKFLPSTEDWVFYDTTNSPLPSNEIMDISVDIHNNKLVATDNGLAIYNEQGVSFPEQLSKIDTLDFGETEIGTSVSEELTLYNHSSNDLIIDSLTFTDSTFFSDTNLPFVIPQNDSGSILINFLPDTVGIYRDKMLIYTSSGVYVQMLYGKGKLPSGIVPQNQRLSFYLGNSYPNPFNPTTRIKYQIPELSNVRLTVYDVLGREIKILVNEEKPAGAYEVRFDGSDLSSGVYIMQLRSGTSLATKKIILAK